MKTTICICAFLLTNIGYSQLQRTIDKELLSDMVLAKQEEFQKRFLVNFIRKNIKMTNSITYNTMYDIMDVLLREKNKTTMTNALVHKVADYSISYAAVGYFIKTDCEACKEAPHTGYVPSSLDKKQERWETTAYTAGFKNSAEFFAELADAYKEARIGSTASKKKRNRRSNGTGRSKVVDVDKNADFLVGLHNWLLDETYQRLSTQLVFRELGLFEPDKGRTWQWSGLVSYDEFWQRYGTARRDMISKQLDAFIEETAKNGGKLIEMASAVGLANADRLEGFDIRILGDWNKKTPVETIGSTLSKDTQGAGTTSSPIKQPSGDAKSDTAAKVIAVNELGSAADQPFARAMNELGGLLEKLRAVQGSSTSGNDNIGAIFELFLKTVELYRKEVGQNSIIASISDIIAKYVILDPETSDPLARYGFSIDVEAIILGLEDRLIDKGSSPTKNAWLNVRPFMTIGLNYGYFGGPSEHFEVADARGLQQVAWAGEKIGLKWRVWDWKYTRGQPNMEWYEYHGTYYRRMVRPRVPDVSNWYVSLYASGILYNIADLRTDETFRRPLVGLGTGLTFFNGLELNVSYAVPIIEGFDLSGAEIKGFANVGFDIPIFDYIRAARAK